MLILIWFVKFIERTVCAIIPQKEQDEEYRLRFITGGMLSTAELSILQASKEIHLFAERTHRMFGMVRDLLHTEKDDDFNKLFSRIEKYENISDSMELEIANYLNQVSEGRLSSESKLQIRAMLREVTEIEVSVTVVIIWHVPSIASVRPIRSSQKSNMSISIS